MVWTSAFARFGFSSRLSHIWCDGLVLFWELAKQHGARRRIHYIRVSNTMFPRTSKAEE
jgi:hypothetical protein